MLLLSILITLLLNTPSIDSIDIAGEDANRLESTTENKEDQNGVIKGRIVYGKGAVNKTLNFIKDENTCGTADLVDESLNTDDKGGLRWAVVSIEGGVEGQNDLSNLNSERTLNQLHCVFRPHVVITGVNQDLTINNHDHTLHNVRTVSFMNDAINKIQMYIPGGEAPSDKFKFSEVEVVEVKCDVHGWMKAFVHVVDHPYYVVTSEAGEFEFTGLPNGKYTINVWHEKLGKISKELVVNEGEASDIELVYK